jgi:hypothetical protein
VDYGNKIDMGQYDSAAAILKPAGEPFSKNSTG